MRSGVVSDLTEPEAYSGIFQKKIVSNALAHLQLGRLFFYITCSVFKKENEDIVAYIKKEFHLQLFHLELLKGYDKQADTMFTAVFKK